MRCLAASGLASQTSVSFQAVGGNRFAGLAPSVAAYHRTDVSFSFPTLSRCCKARSPRDQKLEDVIACATKSGGASLSAAPRVRLQRSYEAAAAPAKPLPQQPSSSSSNGASRAAVKVLPKDDGMSEEDWGLDGDSGAFANDNSPAILLDNVLMHDGAADGRLIRSTDDVAGSSSSSSEDLYDDVASGSDRDMLAYSSSSGVGVSVSSAVSQPYVLRFPAQASSTDDMPNDRPSTAPLTMEEASRVAGGHQFNPNVFITSRIKACRTWQETHAVLREHGQLFNHINAAALLTHMAQRSESRTMAAAEARQFEAALEEALDVAHAFTHQFGTRQLANVVWATARLGFPCCRAFLTHLLPHSRALLGWFEPQHLANTVWAVATAGVEVPPGWMDDFLLHSTNAMPRSQPQHLTNTVWALAKLGVAPTADWLAAFTVRLAEVVPKCNDQDVSGILWALATLRCPIRSSLVRGLLQQLLPQLDETAISANQKGACGCSDQSLSSTLWALATLSYVPAKAWMVQISAALDRRAAALTPQALANTLWAASTLGQPLPAGLLQRVLAMQAPELAQMEPVALATLAWALESTGGVAPRSSSTSARNWVVQMLQAVLLRLRDHDAHSIAACLHVTVVYGQPPAVEWMTAVLTHFHTAAASGTPQAVSTVLWSISRLGFSLNPDALDSLLAILVAKLTTHPTAQLARAAPVRSLDSAGTVYTSAQLSAQESSTVLCALARLRHTPGDRRVLALLIRHSTASLPSANTQELANSLWALSALKLVPEPSWWDAWLQASAATMSAMNPRDLSQTIMSMAKLDVRAPPAWLAAFYQEVGATLHSARWSGHDASTLAWGLGRLGGAEQNASVEYKQLGELFLGQLTRACDTFSGPQLAISLWGLSQMGYQAAAGSLRPVEYAVFKRMPLLQPRELAATISAFSTMRYVPDVEWLEDYTNQVILQSSAFSSQDWTVVVRALSHLGGAYKLAYTTQLLDTQLAPRVRELGPGALAMLMCACARLGIKPALLLARCLARVVQEMQALSPPELSAVICSSAKLKLQLDPGFRAAFWRRSGDVMPGAAPSVLCCFAWALAELSILPPDAWTAKLVAALEETGVQQMTAQETAMLVWALSEFRATLPKALLDTLVEHWHSVRLTIHGLKRRTRSTLMMRSALTRLRRASIATYHASGFGQAPAVAAVAVGAIGAEEGEEASGVAAGVSKKEGVSGTAERVAAVGAAGRELAACSASA